jgi:hypothetical protein
VAQPGTQVLIDGEPADVDRGGRFSVAVARDPKEKTGVLVTMRDALGREQSNTVPCIGEEPEAPIRDVGVRWRKKGHP